MDESRIRHISFFEGISDLSGFISDATHAIPAIRIIFSSRARASRVLFAWVLQSAWGAARWRRVVVGILRGPGNLLHETSHAVGYLLAGYRVRSSE